MGKRRGGRSGGGGNGGNRTGSNAPSSTNRGSNQRTTAWTSTEPIASEIFLKYYKAQNLVPEEEWDEFLHALQQPLPTTFRLTSCRAVAPRLNQQIEETFVPFLTGIEHEGVPLEAPKKLSWYPGGFAWQLNIPRQAIRKQDAFKKFQHFLVHEADCGNLSRQEAVSMIPPLLLDVQPHHHVLDMCAAPGSKTVQLLEALIGSEKLGGQASGGLLIANDSDAKRCHLLVHQSLHRVPGTGMMVTNHDATQLPGLRLPTLATNANAGKFIGDDKEEEEEVVAEGTKRQKKYEPLLYDRILADVPCSGDGTLRKNLAIWKEFTPGNGTGLHSLQLRILLRGIALLKPGGRLVYSTCSMNPIENEAVLSAALSLCPEMSILDVSSSLPELKRRPGMTDWVVLDNAGNPPLHPDHPVPSPTPVSEVTSATEGETAATARQGNKKKEKVWSKTLWPSGKEKELGLEKALRIYGHLQDTGAFFVCVLFKKGANEVAARGGEETTAKRTSDDVEATVPEAKKAKSEPEVEKETETEAVVEDTAVEEQVDVSSLPAEIVGANVFSTKTRDFKEEPFIYLNPDDEQVRIFSDFFDLSPLFPRENLLVRNAAGAPLRSIYFTSSSTRALLLSNSFTRMRLISCGVKIFTRQDSTRDGTYACKWRVNSEGLEVLRPHMGTKRIVTASVETLRRLMSSLTVGFEELDEVAFKERIAEMEPGSCVLQVDAKGEGLLFEQKLTLPFWRSKNTVNLMVEKVEKSALSLRLFGEDLTPHKIGPKARDLAKAEGKAKVQGEAATAPVAGAADAAALASEKADDVPLVEAAATENA